MRTMIYVEGTSSLNDANQIALRGLGVKSGPPTEEPPRYMGFLKGVVVW